MHYSKRNTADATGMNVALASLGQQTSLSLQSLCFVPCNAIYYFISPLLKIRFSVPVERGETRCYNPRVSPRSTGAKNRTFNRGVVTKIF